MMKFLFFILIIFSIAVLAVLFFVGRLLRGFKRKVNSNFTPPAIKDKEVLYQEGEVKVLRGTAPKK